jgi:uncharacterized protein
VTQPLPATGLSPDQLAAMAAVFSRHTWIDSVRLYGSRAKGNYRPYSDVDLALYGTPPPLQVQAVAQELDDLATPYLFDVQAYADIRYVPLREHIDRIGLVIYPVSESADSGKPAE